MTKKGVILLVLDGFGVSTKKKGNAILKAKTPNIDNYMRDYPHTTLKASGKYVGLPAGFMGNSEVGHLHLGSGRLVEQDMLRISKEIKSGKFFENKILVRAMKSVKPTNALHLLGLLSDAGVHAHISHLFALLDMARKLNVGMVYLHLFLDGRDMPPKSAMRLIRKVERKLKSLDPFWRIGCLIGRYYAMDRDNRWNREHKAYDAIVNCKGTHYRSVKEAIEAAYARGETDEFVKPSLVGYTCNVKEGDVAIFFNFRSDRARELTRAFVQGRFNKFKRKKVSKLKFVTLVQYDKEIKAPVAYKPIMLKNTFGEVIAKAGLKQFRLAETEKWAHVTYFFNGLSGKIFKNEDRKLIPSPKVSTYDKIPEMSAYKITAEAVKRIKSRKYDFILINYANADMVGHTGNLDKTVKAVQVLDRCVSKIVETALRKKYNILITSDHGNAEQKLLANGSPSTTHTTNEVPLIIINDKKDKKHKLKKGALYDIAPTILKLLNIKKPKEMTGKDLV